MLGPGLSGGVAGVVDDPADASDATPGRPRIDAAVVAKGVAAVGLGCGRGEGSHVRPGQVEPALIAVDGVQGEVPQARPGRVRRVDLLDTGLEVVAAALTAPKRRVERLADGSGTGEP